MESNYIITDNSHHKIYQTYAELKNKLPRNFLKMKVISVPKYSIDKKPILKKIENDNNKKLENSLGKNHFINKNIYILNDETMKLKRQRNLKPIFINEPKYEEIPNKTLLTEKDRYIDYNEDQYNQDQYNHIYDLIKNSQADHQGYYFHSHPVTDAQMKANIYLPRIVDRMKYCIPRNERDKEGFHIEGIGIFSNNKIKYDEKNDNYEININTNNKKNYFDYENGGKFRNLYIN